MLFDSEILFVTVVQVACLEISRLRTHEVRKLEGDGFVVVRTFGSFEFHTEFIELDRKEVDRHVAVKSLGIGPALHVVFVGKAFVYGEESVEFIVVDMSVLEGASIYYIMNTVEYLVPFFFVFLNRNSLVVGHLAGTHHRFLTIDPRRNKGR